MSSRRSTPPSPPTFATCGLWDGPSAGPHWSTSSLEETATAIPKSGLSRLTFQFHRGASRFTPQRLDDPVRDVDEDEHPLCDGCFAKRPNRGERTLNNAPWVFGSWTRTVVKRTTRFTMLVHLPREEGYRHKETPKHGPPSVVTGQSR